MQIKKSEYDNITRWNHERGFYEVYYLKFNEISSSTAFWIRYTILSPLNGDAVAEVWAIFFDALNPGNNSAFKETFPISEAELSKDRFYFRIGNSEIAHNFARGEIKKDNGYIRWDLNYIPGVRTFYHYPHSIMYRLRIPKTKVCSPNFDIKIDGKVEVNGREIICNHAPGQQSHIWGTKHAERWVWANCNLFKNSGGIFEGISAQIRIGNFITPPLTPLYVKFREEEFYMNGLLRAIKNSSSTEFPRWRFSGECGRYRFEGDVFAEDNNFVGVEYTDPDGEKLWCYNTKVADMKIKVFLRDRQVDELVSERCAAFEFVSRERIEGVPVLI